MKVNHPVTQIETLLAEGQVICSSTDLKGVIVEANEAFAAISNFSRDEMIGQSRNIVRHPEAKSGDSVRSVTITALVFRSIHRRELLTTSPNVSDYRPITGPWKFGCHPRID